MKKNPAAELGKKGGQARAKNLTAKQRQEIARKAGLASGKARKKKHDYLLDKFYSTCYAVLALNENPPD